MASEGKKVLILGATDMIGQGALRECLLDPQVAEVLSVVRRPSGRTHPKLREIVHGDFLDFSDLEGELKGLDTCLFCLGVSAAGMSESEYSLLTHDLTLGVAATLARINPGMTFVYVSGAHTDSTGRGRTMWARVKGITENDLLKQPFRAVYLFRPGAIQPLHGIRSSTRLYRVMYRVFAPVFPLLKVVAPNSFTTTEKLGRAMLRAGLRGSGKVIHETPDINELGAAL